MTIAQTVRHSAHGAWIDRAARAGFLAKAVVYAVIGGFALRFGLGHGGGLLDSKQTIGVVGAQPFGRFLLALLGTGLACHGLCLALQGVVDPDGRRDDLRHVGERIVWIGSAFVYGFLAVCAFQLLVGHGMPGHRLWARDLLAWHGGRWVLIGIGIGVVIGGLHQIYAAYTAAFRERLDLGSMSPRERTWAIRLGRIGLVARGVVLPIVGWMFIHAGVRANPRLAGDTAAALREIASQPSGPLLVGLVGGGLLAHALYLVVNARYRRTLA